MTTPRIFAVPLLAVVIGMAATASVRGQPQNPPGRAIFTCTDASGKKLTSDRLIAECMGREQRILNADGSLREIVPPTLTAEERAAADARERKAATERAAKAEAVRRDRGLMARYPDEATHQKARAAALDNVRRNIKQSEARLATLANERKPLLADAEFYAGKPLPPKLKAQLDANDVSTEAQRALLANQKDEMARVEKTYDDELARLKRLWAGTPPGSAELAAAASAPTTRK
jgi:chromosome segregation ATPase